MNLAKYICGFIYSLCVLGNAAYAQTPTADTVQHTDSTQRGRKYILLEKPQHLYVGLDPVKAVWNIATPDRLRAEAHADAYFAKNIIINSTLGFSKASYASTNLSYKTTSLGGDISVCRSLFPAMNKYDLDGAFVGIGYGLAYNRIGAVQYQISDLWGTQSGVLPPSNMVLHWVQLTAGFGVQISMRTHLGWRVYGRSIVNARRITEIAPIYTAPYGAGDKLSVFAYNFFATLRLW
jgi:hypothetical protein